VIAQLPASPASVENNSESSAIQRLEPIIKTSVVRQIRKMGTSFTPSIKDAIAGNTPEKNELAEDQNKKYSEYEVYNEPFTAEQLAAKWSEFMGQLVDRPNLRSTLSNVPEITDGNNLLLRIGNSIQEMEIRLVKPELVTWLRKELRNSGIEMTTQIEKVESERMIFSDSEKMQMMMQKNPLLYELKQKFNLDFKD
jgi:hypothetical protein